MSRAIGTAAATVHEVETMVGMVASARRGWTRAPGGRGRGHTVSWIVHNELVDQTAAGLSAGRTGER